MLRLLCVGDHVLDGGLGFRAEFDQTHGKSGGLASNGIVLKVTKKAMTKKCSRALRIKCYLNGLCLLFLLMMWFHWASEVSGVLQCSPL